MLFTFKTGCYNALFAGLPDDVLAYIQSVKIQLAELLTKLRGITLPTILLHYFLSPWSILRCTGMLSLQIELG